MKIHRLSSAMLFLFAMFVVSASLAQTKSIILGRPTDKTITASILFNQKVEFYLEYGVKSGVYTNQTTSVFNVANTPNEVDITGLTANTRYYYRMQYRLLTATSFSTTPEYTFMTQRSTGSAFTFVVEADEHLYDKKGVRSMYQLTLQNELKDSPDFMLSLGDIFGDDHTPTTTTSADMDALHKDYLQYLTQICHSVPFFVCLGNHEGENGYYLKQNPPNNIAVYGTKWRKFYYPNPFPNTFYSGNMVSEGYEMNLPENYFAWTWGDALFVVLDVYRHVDVNEKPQNWDWTLGKTQFDWFKKTLENSKAKYKFVFAHHTRGQGRGGISTAKSFEWGGIGTKGVNDFEANRPGWGGVPIHQLMVKNGVNIFFQGHDHLYAKEELDGVVYQEVPMPSDSTYQIGMLANADAYTDVTREGTGHIRVSVSPECLTVDFVRAYLPADVKDGKHQNREIGYSYSIGKCAVITGIEETQEVTQFVKVSPNPTHDVLLVEVLTAGSFDRKVEILSSQGQVMKTLFIRRGEKRVDFDVSDFSSGVYFVKCTDELGTSSTTKVIIQK